MIASSIALFAVGVRRVVRRPAVVLARGGLVGVADGLVERGEAVLRGDKYAKSPATNARAASGAARIRAALHLQRMKVTLVVAAIALACAAAACEPVDVRHGAAPAQPGFNDRASFERVDGKLLAHVEWSFSSDDDARVEGHRPNRLRFTVDGATVAMSRLARLDVLGTDGPRDAQSRESRLTFTAVLRVPRGADLARPTITVSGCSELDGCDTATYRPRAPYTAAEWWPAVALITPPAARAPTQPENNAGPTLSQLRVVARARASGLRRPLAAGRLLAQPCGELVGLRSATLAQGPPTASSFTGCSP